MRDKRKACSVVSEKEIFQIDNRLFYKLCPANYWNASSQELIGIYGKFDKGLLPYKGGIMEQPAKFIEVMDLIESLTIKQQEEMSKKAQRKWQRTKSK